MERGQKEVGVERERIKKSKTRGACFFSSRLAGSLFLFARHRCFLFPRFAHFSVVALEPICIQQ